MRKFFTLIRRGRVRGPWRKAASRPDAMWGSDQHFKSAFFDMCQVSKLLFGVQMWAVTVWRAAFCFHSQTDMCLDKHWHPGRIHSLRLFVSSFTVFMFHVSVTVKKSDGALMNKHIIFSHTLSNLHLNKVNIPSLHINCSFELQFESKRNCTPMTTRVFLVCVHPCGTNFSFLSDFE